jgi:D-apionolactonase
MAATKRTLAEKLTGTNEPANTLKPLRAGDITALYDNGALRNICYRGVEVVRGIAFLCRNTKWGTYAPTISALRVKQTPSSFKISYSAICKDETQQLHYTVAIQADAKSGLNFHATGLPKTDFITNRTGFVVLHPIEGVAGKPLTIEHTDGKVEKTRFPKLISPGQPAFWIRSMAHQPMPGVTATVRMEGDAFEMEDHRNWMDASYKTYVHSLLDTWPYTLERGRALKQSVTVQFKGKPKVKLRAAAGKQITLSLGKPKGKIPDVSTFIAMHDAVQACGATKKLVAAGVKEIVAQLDGRKGGIREAAHAYAEIARETGTRVKLELILPAKQAARDEITRLADVALQAKLTPVSIVITQAHDLVSFQPNQPRPWGPSYEDMAEAARNAFPNVAVGGGMLSTFTELNRKPLARGVFDFVTHSVCPIVHAADDVSVMETLEALASMFVSTRAMVGRMPYHLGPSGISARDNPYGPSLSANPNGIRMCLAGNDPREKGTFAAAWFVGLAAACARGGLSQMTLGQAVGPAGLINADATLTPAFHAIAALAMLGGAKAVATTSSHPAEVAGLAAKSGGKTTLCLANLSREKRSVNLRGLKGPITVHEISHRTFEHLSKDPAWLQRRGARLAQRRIDVPSYAVLVLQGT